MKRLLTILSTILLVASCSKVPDDNIVIIDEPKKEQPQEQQPQDVNDYKTDVISRIECPKTRGGNNIIVVKNDDEYGVNYFLEWDCDKRAQRWTAYRMYKGNTATTVSRSGDDAWHEDEQIPFEYRSTYEDYHYSGFDRGHICPSADRLQNRNMNRQTFCYSNMHPQYNALNAFVWADMETKVRSWNRDSFRDTLYVVKGGTIDGKDYVFDFLTHDEYGVLIPKYFFMAILCLKNGKYKALGFWIEHKPSYSQSEQKSIKQYAVSIDELEQRTGIDFFCNLDDEIEEATEKATDVAAWSF
ncbi:MAG: DNA/RNA non-specific endonuclease [Bacteroidales bacterium]|nr:DNA/RNA non-specific endonuclease [Bacteroidales bacterium]